MTEQKTKGFSLGGQTPFEVINPDGPTPVLLICDHASRQIPAELSNLGLESNDFNRHIAYDIGAEAVTRNLANAHGMAAVLATYSRLVIDLNRPLGHPESIPEISDDTRIPGNLDLNETDKTTRASLLFEPYHDAINKTLAHIWNKGPTPALFSIHSFTPHFGDESRPWDVGILWNRDPRLAVPLMDRLEGLGLHVGDNQPYSGRDNLAYTIDMHGTAAGLANCAIEIRQDLISDAKGIERWSQMLVEVFKEIIELEGIFKVRHF